MFVSRKILLFAAFVWVLIFIIAISGSEPGIEMAEIIYFFTGPAIFVGSGLFINYLMISPKNLHRMYSKDKYTHYIIMDYISERYPEKVDEFQAIMKKYYIYNIPPRFFRTIKMAKIFLPEDKDLVYELDKAQTWQIRITYPFLILWVIAAFFGFY